MRALARLTVTTAALAVVTSGCGSTDGVPTADGGPADAARAERTVEVAMLDTLAYDPAEITVAVGETVTFAVTNPGETTHEFALGTDAEQQEHSEEMMGSEGMAGMDHDMGGMSHDRDGVVSLEPGGTGELTWTFTEPGEYRYGCHEPGHFEGGMVGTITVTP